MGVFSKLFELKSDNNSTGGMYPQIVKMRGATPQYTDGKYRNIAQLGYSENWVIYRCLQEIIKACIQLDWCVMKYNKDGKPEEILNHPVQQLIEKPNRIYSQSEMIKRIVAFYYIAGDVPLIKYTVRGNTTYEFYSHRPDKVSFTLTGNIDQPYTDIKYEGQTAQNVDPINFTLFKNFNPLDQFDGLGRGMSALKPVLKNGDLLGSMLDWNISLMQNCASVSGVISVDPNINLSDKQFERAQSQIKNRYAGKEKAGNIMILEGGSRFFETSHSPKEMDWNQSKLDAVKDVAVGMGVDPILLGFNESASYNNKNEAEKGLYLKTAIPLMKELCDCLGPFLGLQDDEYLDVKYDHIPILQEDMKELSDKLNANNFMKINEKRERMGLEQVEGGDIVAPSGSYAIIEGKLYLPTNLIPIDEETTQSPVNPSSQEENKSAENFLY